MARRRARAPARPRRPAARRPGQAALDLAQRRCRNSRRSPTPGAADLEVGAQRRHLGPAAPRAAPGPRPMARSRGPLVLGRLEARRQPPPSSSRRCPRRPVAASRAGQGRRVRFGRRHGPLVVEPGSGSPATRTRPLVLGRPPGAVLARPVAGRFMRRRRAGARRPAASSAASAAARRPAPAPRRGRRPSPAPGCAPTRQPEAPNRSPSPGDHHGVGTGQGHVERRRPAAATTHRPPDQRVEQASTTRGPAVAQAHVAAAGARPPIGHDRCSSGPATRSSGRPAPRRGALAGAAGGGPARGPGGPVDHDGGQRRRRPRPRRPPPSRGRSRSGRPGCRSRPSSAGQPVGAGPAAGLVEGHGQRLGPGRARRGARTPRPGGRPRPAARTPRPRPATARPRRAPRPGAARPARPPRSRPAGARPRPRSRRRLVGQASRRARAPGQLGLASRSTLDAQRAQLAAHLGAAARRAPLTPSAQSARSGLARRRPAPPRPPPARPGAGSSPDGLLARPRRARRPAGPPRPRGWR